MPILDEAIKSNFDVKEAAILVLGVICDQDACLNQI